MHTKTGLGRIGGVTVAVNWSTFVLVLLLTWVLASNYLPALAPGESTPTYWTVGLVGSVLVLFSLLAHELAHAMVARHEGVRVESLTLWMLGGVTRLGGRAESPSGELRIAAVGPGVSALLCACFIVAAVALSAVGADHLTVSVARWLALMNGSLALFNLLPGAPLDGGRILSAILWRRRGDRTRAAMTAARVGRALGLALCAIAILAALGGDGVGGLWMVLIGGFLVLAARAEYATSVTERLLEPLRASDVMSSPVSTAPATLTVDQFVSTHLIGGRGSAYPVVGPDQDVVGMVTLHQIRTMPRTEWPSTTVGQICLPLDRLQICHPSDPAADVHGTADSGGRALVMDGDHLVGIVTPTDIARAMRARALLEGTSLRHDPSLI